VGVFGAGHDFIDKLLVLQERNNLFGSRLQF
jgi:hypothetical protein